jgi:hypothetical protein
MWRTALAVLVLVTGSAVGGDAPDYVKLKDEWEAKAKAWREGKVAAATAEVKHCDEKIAALRKKLQTAPAPQAGKLKAEIAGYERLKAGKEKDAAKWEKRFPVTDPDAVTEGAFAKFGVNGSSSTPPVFKVVQVIDRDNALLSWGAKTYWVELDAAKLADGDTVTVTAFVHHKGTKQYVSAGGVKRTVRLFRFVD